MVALMVAMCALLVVAAIAIFRLPDPHHEFMIRMAQRLGSEDPSEAAAKKSAQVSRVA